MVRNSNMVALVVFAALLSAQQADQLPDTVPAKRMNEFIESFNTKDSDKIGGWISSNFSPNALKILSKDEWTKRISGAFNLAPISVAAVLKSSDTTLIVRLKGNTNLPLALRLDLETDKPYQVVGAALGNPDEVMGIKNTKKYAHWATLETLVNQVVKDYKLPALSVAYEQIGKPALYDAEGVKSSKQPTEIADGDRMQVGALGKSMTATLLSKLVEMKKLTWTSTLAEMLPNVKLAEAYKTVTIDDLFQHKSGLPREFPYGMDDMQKMTEKAKDATDVRRIFVSDLLSRASVSKPGTQLVDSDVDYVVAGYIAERLIGKSFEWLMQRYVFDPMKMKSAMIAPIGSEGQVGSQGEVLGHLYGDFGYTPFLLPNPVRDMMLAPAGADITCSMFDLEHFASLHLTGMKGTDNVLTAASYKHMHTAPSGTSRDQDLYGWTFNPSFASDEPCQARSGTDGSCYADMTIWPDNNLVIVAATNAGVTRQPSPTLQVILAIRDRYENKEN